MTLRVGDVRFGVWIDQVLEVVRTPPISRLPLPDREIAGVSAVRGEVIPVLDLGIRLLGTPVARPGRLVLVRHTPSGSMVGLLVDALEALLPVRDADVQDPPEAAEHGISPELTAGVVVGDEAVVTILDLERAAAPPADDTKEKERT
jgi:chemotaxis signal transduction protein